MIKLDIYHVMSWSLCVSNSALLQALLSWVYLLTPCAKLLNRYHGTYRVLLIKQFCDHQSLKPNVYIKVYCFEVCVGYS